MRTQRSPAPELAHPRLVSFGPLRAPARFTGCDDLLAAVSSILRGWGIREVPAGRAPRPLVRVKKTPAGFRRVSLWRNRPSLVREKVRRTVVEALCGFHFELIDWYAREHPDQLCLHAAAASLSGGLVVFPALQRAGKSVLTVELARRGVPVFCDDVLPVDVASRRGIALGIVPRLRPPLPADASPDFRAYVERHAGPGYRNRLYVAVPDAVLPSFGARAPIRAIVLLERRERARAAIIEDVDPVEALETLILQNFGREAPAGRVLDALHAIVSRAACLRLRYARSADAATRLTERFA